MTNNTEDTRPEKFRLNPQKDFLAYQGRDKNF